MEYREGKYLIQQMQNRNIRIIEDFPDGSAFMIFHAQTDRLYNKGGLKAYLHDVLKMREEVF